MRDYKFAENSYIMKLFSFVSANRVVETFRK